MRSSSITISFLLAFALFTFSARAAIHHVDVNSTNPVTPYLTWDTAAVTIQDAENASAFGDEILVTNGIYAAGGMYDSRIYITRAKFVHSVNGPDVTIIQGYQPPGTTNGPGSVRCAELLLGVTLEGFTLTGGAAPGGGGGVYAYGAVSNCDITHNTASMGGGAYVVNGATASNYKFHENLAQSNGGGVYSGHSGIVMNCTLSNNLALGNGGGMAEGTCLNSILAGNQGLTGGGAYHSGLSNCLLTDNTGFYGGGGYACDVTSCTVVSNSATVGGGLYVLVAAGSGTAFVPTNTIIYHNNASSNGPNCYIPGPYTIQRSCCTTLDYAGGSDITNEPVFIDPASGDFRLGPNSPCINADRNSYVTNSTDLDGNPRIAGGTVDIGAYEFQNPSSALSYAWLQKYGLPTNGSADYSDPDGDGMNDWQEWITNTDPTNSLSSFKCFHRTSQTMLGESRFTGRALE
jgi:hypothetical protein